MSFLFFLGGAGYSLCRWHTTPVESAPETTSSLAFTQIQQREVRKNSAWLTDTWFAQADTNTEWTHTPHLTLVKKECTCLNNSVQWPKTSSDLTPITQLTCLCPSCCTRRLFYQSCCCGQINDFRFDSIRDMALTAMVVTKPQSCFCILTLEPHKTIFVWVLHTAFMEESL